MTHLIAQAEPEPPSHPGGGQHAQPQGGQFEAVGPFLEVKLVELLGTALLDTLAVSYTHLQDGGNGGPWKSLRG